MDGTHPDCAPAYQRQPATGAVRWYCACGKIGRWIHSGAAPGPKWLAHARNKARSERQRREWRAWLDRHPEFDRRSPLYIHR
jgi:hypothetical protein